MIQVAKRQAGGVGEDAARSWGLAVARPQAPSCYPIAPRLRFFDIHEAVAAALLGRFDDRAAEAVEGGGGRLGNAALGDQRHECGDAELGEFFDEPFLAIAFGERDADHEFEWEFAVDLAAFDDPQLGIRSTQGLDGCSKFSAAAVEECYFIAN